MGTKNSSSASQVVPEWSALELRGREDTCELVDVRGADEFDGPLSHIEESKLVTLGDELTKFLNQRKLLKDPRPLVFVCRSGMRSMTAALQARSLGIENVVNLKGGMIAWNDASLPTHHTKRSK